ncbi:FAD binding domain-containing protein [Frigidibacter sp. ROC022]|uniref:FAD binding domain-containing protein n=1 Tax=Frigidibacter sp. ROC022 TaxID=2971796 RepID=UPI00215A6223|nr:FAD binding domain-containing protein [Frigidibacter sp. ROC022]MCR8725759.1 FAD binding domain-containing protein [Frigidibacter sp. ROC022]
MLTVETYANMAEAAGAVGDRARYLGGGTLVMQGVNYGDQSFDRVVRCREVDRDIRSESGGIRIGAGATMADILASHEVEFLHQVARRIGGPAIRNMATVGGNLFAQNPYGDLTTALLALDAQVLRIGSGPEPIESFLSGRSRPRGLVEAVVVPRVSSGEFRFAKVSRVKPKGASTLCLAVWLRGGGRPSDPRIAWGNMGPTPLRAKAAERALNGASLDEAGIAPVLAVATDGLDPQDDALASAWYRREVAAVHLKRLLLRQGVR